MSSISIYYNKIDYSHFWSLHLTLACSFFTTCVFFKLHTRICLNSRHLFFFILGSFSFGPNYNYFREVLPFSFHRSKKRIFAESLSSSQTMLQSSKFTINQATPLFPLRTLQSFFNSPSPTSSHIKMKRMSDYAKSFCFLKSRIRVHYHWKPSTMATSQVHLLELNVVHCRETVRMRLLRFWEALNVKKAGELMVIDMLLINATVSRNLISIFSLRFRVF